MGVSVAEAGSIYGAYTTLAVPVFNLIPALIAPVAMALVPGLSAAVERRDKAGRNSVIEAATRLTALAAIPAAMGVATFAQPILGVLFSGQSEAVSVAAPMLSILGVSVLFSCLMTTANAILQAQGHVILPIISMSVGVVLKAASTYILIGIPEVGALGAPIGSLVCGFAVTAIDLWFVSRNSEDAISPWRAFILPLIASCPSIGAALAAFNYATMHTSGEALPLLIAIAVAMAVYGAVSFLTGNIKLEDFALLRHVKKEKTNE
jgi:O-antigen/teichoic acid export membrane protein